MCKDHEHRFSVDVKITKGGDVINTCISVYAIGIAAAIAKADYWATENYKCTGIGDTVELKCWRTNYSSIEVALAHGAVPPSESTLSVVPQLKRMNVSELSELIQRATAELASRT